MDFACTPLDNDKEFVPDREKVTKLCTPNENTGQYLGVTRYIYLHFADLKPGYIDQRVNPKILLLINMARVQ